MFCQRSNRRQAFTLIELLTVVTIMSIIMGMVVVSVGRVRRQARSRQAELNIRELTDAWKSYLMVYGSLPDVIPATTPSRGLPANEVYLAPLLGDNRDGLVFLNAELRNGRVHSGENDYGFIDPWGTLYRLTFTQQTIEEEQSLEVTVFFPNRDRNKF